MQILSTNSSEVQNTKAQNTIKKKKTWLVGNKGIKAKSYMKLLILLSLNRYGLHACFSQ